MGPIQTNKIGLIVKNSYLVHSVDREKVLKKWILNQKRLTKYKRFGSSKYKWRSLKSGIFPGDAEEFITLLIASIT